MRVCVPINRTTGSKLMLFDASGYLTFPERHSQILLIAPLRQVGSSIAKVNRLTLLGLWQFRCLRPLRIPATLGWTGCPDLWCWYFSVVSYFYASSRFVSFFLMNSGLPTFFSLWYYALCWLLNSRVSLALARASDNLRLCRSPGVSHITFKQSCRIYYSELCMTIGLPGS